MEISKIYNPADTEQKWYQYWLEHKFFESKPDEREPFTIVIPPPNVTGVLHMGHLLNNTIQDVLIRRARMQGKNACWVPGTDHAAIATEAKVVAMLKEKGIEKKDISREEFLKYAFEWKEKYGGIILHQLQKLGASCDWSRTRFTMEDNLSEAVIDAFVQLYEKGLIYRGIRMVNWDPVGKTALSDEEVIFKDNNAKLYYVKYEVQGSREEISLSNAIFVFYDKDLPTKEYTTQPLKNAFLPAFFVNIDGKEVNLLDIEVETKEGEIKKIGDLQALAQSSNSNLSTIATNKFLDIIYQVQNQVAKFIGIDLQADTTLIKKEFITVATVRPETILGDTAVCVNPNDERYKHLVGKTVIVPIINREVPIIADEYVDATFGTGALKITPAHDINDYEIGLKHNLPVIDTIADDGKMSDACGVAKYVGKDRFVCRKEITKDIKEAGLLEKEEDYKNQVGTSERTGAIIEPKLSLQWFLKMQDISKPALDNVMNDTIQFHPPKFKNMYKSWMENVRDWCLSRQLWWGQQIPAYYDNEGNIIVAKNLAEATAKYKTKFGKEPLTPLPNGEGLGVGLKQDEDVLDTWASSWLWPISVFSPMSLTPNPSPKEKGTDTLSFGEGKGEALPPLGSGGKDFEYYYPTSVLVTGFDIIFFWVARMIMAGYEFTGKLPFKDVYFTGLIRDRMGRKMSKSLGNSPEALRLIELYSADGVRFGLLRSSAAGNDLLFDTDVPKSQKVEDVEAFMNDPKSHDSKLCEQGRNFANKIWNAFRLLKGWEVDASLPFKHTTAVEWIETKFNQVFAEIDENIAKYRLSEALTDLYNLFWDDYCSWYLEMIKPEGGSNKIDATTYQKTVGIFDKLLCVLHPFMPFITEEVWQNIQDRKAGESICMASYPKAEAVKDASLVGKAQLAFDTIIQIRNLRSKKGLSPVKDALSLHIKTTDNSEFAPFLAYIQRLANLTDIKFGEEKPAKALSFVVKNYECFVPFEEDEAEAQASKADLQKELDYARGFRESVLKKLSNEKFVANAKPEIIENERKKLADAEAKIVTLEEALKN